MPRMRAFRGRVPLRRDDSGFTLIETIVALAIATTVFTSLAYAAVNSLSATQSARMRQQAIDLATQRLEETRAIAFGALGHDPADLTSDAAVASCSGDPCIDPGIGSNEDLILVTAGIAPHIEVVSGSTSNNVEYTLTTYVTEPVNADGSDVKRVTVIASWNDHTQVMTETVSSLVSLTTRGLPLPEFQLTPIGETTQSVNPGATAVWGFSLTNQGATDNWNITVPTGFTVLLDDGDGLFDAASDTTPMGDSTTDGLPDTGRLDPNNTLEFWVTTTVPAGATASTTNYQFVAESVAQAGSSGAQQIADVTLVVVEGVITASPTPSASSTPTPTSTATTTAAPTPSETSCPAATPAPTPTGTNQYNVKAYTLHNSGPVSWPGDPIVDSDVITPLYLDQAPDSLATTDSLPAFSDNLTPTDTPGRILYSAGSFSGASDSYVDFRTQLPKKKYTDTAVLRLWVASVSGYPTSTVSLTGQIYGYDMGTGAPTAIGSSVTTTVASFTCSGFQEVWLQFSVPSVNLGNSEALGVRLWNSGSERVRLAFDHATWPGRFTVVER